MEFSFDTRAEWSGCILCGIAGGVNMDCGNGTQISTLQKTWSTPLAKVTGAKIGFLHISPGSRLKAHLL